ncbi:MAG: GMC family oxidoreductase N-terminal domain-containing protein [Bradyrhizobiaceae bacterium]|nr:GMC family oxidoreductase N-terminal domain-containing protein [Bradyrhizobiaceae bacterium]
MSSVATNFDYVIVGAGSAGCVVANRLSEDASVRVCLVEAGPSDRRFPVNVKSRVPVGNIFFRLDQRYNWLFGYTGEARLHDRTIPCPRGKLLGGTSQLNGMVYMRGQPQDYDDWAALGNAGWAWRDVLPYFQKSENFEPGRNAYHATGGELNVAPQRSPNPLSYEFLDAASQTQLPRNDDFNGATQEGFGFFHLTQKNGERWATSRAFLHPVLSRPNLTVISDAQALKIEFAGRRATGVRLQRGGEVFSVNATREIVLSSGSIGSPHLLLLSGVGPAEQLRRHGIDVVADLPGVGQNLQDHPDVRVTMSERSRMSWGRSLPALLRLAFSPFPFIAARKGPLTATAVEAGGFLKVAPGATRCDVHFVFTPQILDRTRYLPAVHGFSIHVSLLRPKSRGFLELASGDPLAAPILHPNFLSEEDDTRLLVAGLRVARRILSAPTLQRHAGNEIDPGASVERDEALADYVRRNVATIYHPVGTCKMGSDAMAVVDPQLRVRGVEGVRVADASIMPNLVSGNTNAPAIMIGEKGSDLIRSKQAAVAA